MKITAIVAASVIAMTSGLAVADQANDTKKQTLVAEGPVLLTDDEMDKTVAGNSLGSAITVGGGAQPAGQTPWGSICVNSAAATNGFQGGFAQGAHSPEPSC